MCNTSCVHARAGMQNGYLLGAHYSSRPIIGPLLCRFSTPAILAFLVRAGSIVDFVRMGGARREGSANGAGFVSFHTQHFRDTNETNHWVAPGLPCRFSPPKGARWACERYHARKVPRRPLHLWSRKRRRRTCTLLRSVKL